MNIDTTTKALATTLFFATAIAGCSSGSGSGAAGDETHTVGSASVTSHADGSTIVSAVSSQKTDDTLTITFDAAQQSARLVPKFGQPTTVHLDQVPADVEAANAFVSDALARGSDAAHGGAKTGGVTTKSYEPPPADCLHTCYGVCDDAFPNACQNAVCRFGCYVGCTSQ